eukprot:456489-Pelagomonas_calceolata.AAC.4
MGNLRTQPPKPMCEIHPDDKLVGCPSFTEQDHLEKGRPKHVHSIQHCSRSKRHASYASKCMPLSGATARCHRAAPSFGGGSAMVPQGTAATLAAPVPDTGVVTAPHALPTGRSL